LGYGIISRYHPILDDKGNYKYPRIDNPTNQQILDRESGAGKHGYGLYVEFRDRHGNLHRFGHLHPGNIPEVGPPEISVGRKISQGKRVAMVGNTGGSTGPHLHWEVIPPESKTRTDPLACPPPPPCEDCEPPPPPPPSPPLGGLWGGESWGDPHLSTMDEHRYSFQAVGDYIITKATEQGDDFEVQVRYRPGGESWSQLDAIAVRVLGDVVNIFMRDIDGNSLESGFEIIINDEVIGATPSFSRLLPGGGTIQVVNGLQATISWPDHTTVLMTRAGMRVFLPSSRRSKVEGLLGNYDSDRSNDLRVKNGAIIDGTPEELYGDFRQSWRVPVGSSESLFRRGPELWDPLFPRETDPLADLDPSVLERAANVCRDAGVIDPEVFAACIFDVSVSGDDGWAEVSAAFDPYAVSLTVTPVLSFMSRGESRQFEVALRGTTNHAVTWTATGGSIAVTGEYRMTYTAPAEPSEYTITATSVADPQLSATAKVIVIESITNLEFDSNATGRVLDEGNNIYTFNGTAGDVIRLGMATSEKVFSGGVSMKVSSPSDTIVGELWGWSGLTDFVYTQKLTLPENGVYTIEVGNSSGATLDYTLGLALIQDPTPLQVTNGVATINSEFRALGDIQYYSVEAQAGDVVGFELRKPETSRLHVIANLHGPNILYAAIGNAFSADC
jgi:hypothetical protein